MGALPIKSGGGGVWGTFQKAIGAVPVRTSPRVSRVGIADDAVVEFCADLFRFGWSLGQTIFASAETSENKIQAFAKQELRPSGQLLGKTNFKASNIDQARLAA